MSGHLPFLECSLGRCQAASGVSIGKRSAEILTTTIRGLKHGYLQPCSISPSTVPDASPLLNDHLRIAAVCRTPSSDMPKYSKKTNLHLGASDRIRTSGIERKDANTYQRPAHTTCPRHDNDHPSPIDGGRDLKRPAAIWRLRNPAIQHPKTNPPWLVQRDPASDDKYAWLGQQAKQSDSASQRSSIRRSI